MPNTHLCAPVALGQSHIEAVEEVYYNRDRLRGLKMIYEPKYLRFFQARFELQ